MEESSQDISKQDFQRHNNLVCKHYQNPSPKYFAKPNELEKLAYVATVFIFNQDPKNEFKHSKTSPFQPVVPGKK